MAGCIDWFLKGNWNRQKIYAAHGHYIFCTKFNNEMQQIEKFTYVLKIKITSVLSPFKIRRGESAEVYGGFKGCTFIYGSNRGFIYG